jgi:hypothetical protein
MEFKELCFHVLRIFADGLVEALWFGEDISEDRNDSG